MCCYINNWCWFGVLFYMCIGKKFKVWLFEIVVVFKDLGYLIFEGDEGCYCNIFVIWFQLNEGMDLQVIIKEFGLGGMCLVDVLFDMIFVDVFGFDVEEVLDVYECLIMDVICGNQILFMCGDEVEVVWVWIDLLINGWEVCNDVLKFYDQGLVGFDDVMMLLYCDGCCWCEIKV